MASGRSLGKAGNERDGRESVLWLTHVHDEERRGMPFGHAGGGAASKRSREDDDAAGRSSQRQRTSGPEPSGTFYTHQNPTISPFLVQWQFEVVPLHRMVHRFLLPTLVAIQTIVWMPFGLAFLSAPLSLHVLLQPGLGKRWQLTVKSARLQADVA